MVEATLASQRLIARPRAEGDKIVIDYEPLATGSSYVSPAVLIEFGARSMGEPFELRRVRCDAAEYLLGVDFPAVTARAMRPEPTFSEKATAIRVFCALGEFRSSERLSRHWHDVTRLDASGFADAAVADRELAAAVARHKAMFFAQKDSHGAPIDYDKAMSGALQLVPAGAAFDHLARDYQGMVEDGLLLEEAEPFHQLLDRCREIQRKANAQ